MHDLLQSIASKVLQKVSYCEVILEIRDLLEYLKARPPVESSAWHPLGFVLLKLGTVEGLGSIRLHIWPEKGRRPQSPYWAIHNHIWTLNSHIICGGATNEIYRVEPNKKRGVYQFYKVRYEQNKSILEATRIRVSCDIDSSVIHGIGEYYEVGSNQYHATRVPEGVLTSTIVITTDVTPSNPSVVGYLEGNATYIYERQACTPLEVSLLIDKLKSQIRQAPTTV